MSIAIPDSPATLRFRSSTPDAAGELLADARFQEFLKRLGDMLGLAKFELLVTEKELKFAIEGFMFEKEAVAELCAVLSSYAAERG